MRPGAHPASSSCSAGLPQANPATGQHGGRLRAASPAWSPDSETHWDCLPVALKKEVPVEDCFVPAAVTDIPLPSRWAIRSGVTSVPSTTFWLLPASGGGAVMLLQGTLGLCYLIYSRVPSPARLLCLRPAVDSGPVCPGCTSAQPSPSPSPRGTAGRGRRPCLFLGLCGGRGVTG